MYLYQSTISRILLYPALLSLLLSLGYVNIIFNLILYVKFNIITYSSIKSFSTYNTNKFNIWSFSIMRTQNTWAIAMCYVPWQKWGDLYNPCKALKCGTLFPVLSKPFAGGRV